MSSFFPALHGNRFREKRFELFMDLLRPIGRQGRISIIDLGGTVEYWENLRQTWSVFDLDITIVNIGAEHSDDGPYHVRSGDACAIDAADNSYDIVHSNSVIEHVGGWSNMRAMAGEVRRLAPRYYVQVPNFWFPMEPHFRAPFFHWLPEAVRASMIMKKDRGMIQRRESMDSAMEVIQSAQLLTQKQMAALFPDAELHRERLMMMTKSLIAVRDAIGEATSDVHAST